MHHAVYRGHAHRVLRVGRAAAQAQATDGGDTGQTFATKAHAGNAFQIVQRADFAGGMAVQCQGQVIGSNAAAVVTDADVFDATLLQGDVDFAGACV